MFSIPSDAQTNASGPQDQKGQSPQFEQCICMQMDAPMRLQRFGVDNRFCSDLQLASDLPIERCQLQLRCWGSGNCPPGQLCELAFVSTVLVSGPSAKHFQFRCCPSQRVWLEVSQQSLAAWCSQTRIKIDHSDCCKIARQTA